MAAAEALKEAGNDAQPDVAGELSANLALGAASSPARKDTEGACASVKIQETATAGQERNG